MYKNKYLSIFLISYFQITFVAINIKCISIDSYVGSFMSSVLLSYIWVYTVKRMSVGTNLEILCYIVGSALGNVTGMILSKHILNLT